MKEPNRAEQLKLQIARLRASLPRHSIPPAMLQRLEDMEDALEALKEEEEEEEKESDHRPDTP